MKNEALYLMTWANEALLTRAGRKCLNSFKSISEDMCNRYGDHMSLLSATQMRHFEKEMGEDDMAAFNIYMLPVRRADKKK